MVKEKWRTIPDFPEYAVSNKGRFAKKATGKLLGIYRESYCKDRKKVTLYRQEGEGKRKEYRRGVKSIFAAVWPEIINPWNRTASNR